MASKSNFFLAVLMVALCLSAVQEAEADVKVGSCMWGGVDYKEDCDGYCRKRGYKGGHCGSFWNATCWCETN